MTLARALQAIGYDLEGLMNLSIKNKKDLDIWYAEADKVRRKIVSNSELSDMIPHVVWHYLSDADTRFKDSAYEKMQTETICEIISELKFGRVHLRP